LLLLLLLLLSNTQVGGMSDLRMLLQLRST
jgi:hypothetical protein